MRTIHIHKQCDRLQLYELGPFVMAIGYFDGVHYGHQKVINTAVEKAKEMQMKTAVMTFTPHPKEVITKGETSVEQLSTFSQKEAYIKELGVDYLFVVHFNRSFASLTPKQFVKQYIVDMYVRHVVVGFDFTYGAFGKGNVFRLAEDGENQFTISIIHKIELHGEKISSTFIRKLIRGGKVNITPFYLGRTYETIGCVHEINRNVIMIKQQKNMLPPSNTYLCNVKIGRNEQLAHVYCNCSKSTLYLSLTPSFKHVKRKDLVTIEWIKNSEYTWYDNATYLEQRQVTT